MKKRMRNGVEIKMKTIREIEEEVKNDFEKGAAKRLDDIIVGLRGKVYNDNREGTYDKNSAVKLSNENIENFDVFCNSAYADIPTYAEFVGRKFEDDKTFIKYKIYEITETIRQTLVFNAQNNRNVTEVILTYDIPNEGDKPLEYYCENDDVLDSIVKALKDSGYECKTEVRTGLSMLSERLNGTIADGYHYRDIIVEW